jgi:hypothetical protein
MEDDGSDVARAARCAERLPQTKCRPSTACCKRTPPQGPSSSRRVARAAWRAQVRSAPQRAAAQEMVLTERDRAESGRRYRIRAGEPEDAERLANCTAHARTHVRIRTRHRRCLSSSADAMASVPGHAVIAATLLLIERRVAAHNVSEDYGERGGGRCISLTNVPQHGADILYTTGPDALTTAVHAYQRQLPSGDRSDIAIVTDDHPYFCHMTLGAWRTKALNWVNPRCPDLHPRCVRARAATRVVQRGARACPCVSGRTKDCASTWLGICTCPRRSATTTRRRRTAAAAAAAPVRRRASAPSDCRRLSVVSAKHGDRFRFRVAAKCTQECRMKRSRFTHCVSAACAQSSRSQRANAHSEALQREQHFRSTLKRGDTRACDRATSAWLLATCGTCARRSVRRAARRSRLRARAPRAGTTPPPPP